MKMHHYLIYFGLTIINLSFCAIWPSKPATKAAPACSEKINKLSKDMRKLWSDHVIWTRDYIIAAVAEAPDKKAATDRLLQNQVDLGNAVATYYDKDAGDKLTKLLKEHILIAADLVEAAKKDNKQKVKEIDAKWHKNAEDIAVFLSNANHNWIKADLQKMLNEHLDLTKKEAIARIKKNWTEDVNLFDKIFVQALSMADTLTAGIVKQFPTKF